MISVQMAHQPFMHDIAALGLGLVSQQFSTQACKVLYQYINIKKNPV